MPELLPRKRNILKVSIIIVAAVAFVSVTLSLFLLYRGQDELNRIKEAQTQEAQFLLSTLDFKTEQQRTILYIRDVIMTEWSRIGYKKGGYDKAYLISSAVVSEAMKYPYMNFSEMALLMTAMLKQESSFMDSVKSPMGAKGIAQFVPSTGRLMARVLGIEYSDSLLLNPSVAVRMQAVYLDILLTSHDYEIEPSLAEYNGGHWSAFYWKTNRSRLSPETVKYVPEIMARYKGYLADFKTYQVRLSASEKG